MKVKTWTVVIEIKDWYSEMPDQRIWIETFIENQLADHIPSRYTFRIMEMTEAPYGPDKKD